MEEEIYKDDFPERVTREIVSKLKTITKNESDIKSFLLSLINIFKDLKQNEDRSYYRCDSILLFLKEKGLKIPKSMQNSIDEKFMQSIFGYMNNLSLIQFNDVINLVKYSLRAGQKEISSNMIDDLMVKLIGNTDKKRIYLNYNSSSCVLSNIAQQSDGVRFLCQTNNIYDKEILGLESELLKVKIDEEGDGSTVLDPKFVKKDKFDFERRI